MKKLIKTKEKIRFYKFTIVGIIGAIIDFGVMNFLTRMFNMQLSAAGTVSFIIAVLSNFLWNRFWTYPDSRSRSLTRQLSMFFLVSIAGIAIRLSIIFLLETPFRLLFERVQALSGSKDFLTRNITLSISIGIVMLWNFFVNRYWTYNDVDKVK